MKKRVLSIIILAALAVSAATGCSLVQSALQGGDKQAEEQKESKASNKHKYDNIDADSEPVGVDEVKFEKAESGYTHLSGRIYKNSSDIEEGKITVSFEMYDENGDFMGEKKITTEKTLTEGEQERFNDDIIWATADKYHKDIPDETLAKYTVKIVNIEETGADEVELQETLDAIEDLINWYPHDYEKAQILIDEAFKKYPDNVDLKLLQEDLNKAVQEEAQDQQQ
ncbi:MAG: hypothetical protein ACI4EA_05790 [Candidatus Ornithomonoglobus sp.]